MQAQFCPPGVKAYIVHSKPWLDLHRPDIAGIRIKDGKTDIICVREAAVQGALGTGDTVPSKLLPLTHAQTLVAFADSYLAILPVQ